MKKNIYLVAILFLFLGFVSCGTSKQVVDSRPVKEKIESKRYTFAADYAIPTGGFQPRHLTPGYDLKVTPDTITAYLPYFGRAYEAPFDPSEGGIKFTSTKFDYRMTPWKKAGNWLVNIRILDQRWEIFLTLDVWENGKGDLDVRDQSKQSILFRGELE